MNDPRMKITAFAVILGLGGLGGYALSSQQAPQTTATAADVKPKTQVVRRTVHAKPKVDSTATAGGSYSTPVGSAAGSGGSAPAPVSTGSSGGGGYGGDDEEEHEYGDESEGGEDD